MILSIIVAKSRNNVIGRNNQLPWHLTDDLKNFKKITYGHPIIMGRKTYESIGRPLPGRKNIIVSRQKDYKIEGCEVVNSIEEAIKLLQPLNTPEAFIIGGAELIKQTITSADKIYLTEVHADVEGDTFFQPLNPNDWTVLNQTDFLKSEKGNEFDFSVIEYMRK